MPVYVNGVEQGGGAALSGSTNNTITTVTGADAIQGEANLTFDGTTLTMASGQLAFPNTQNASAGANTLDDYEEGTWTPQIDDGAQAATASVAVGEYVKIGKLVHLQGMYTTTAITDVDDPITFGGNPFNNDASSNNNSVFNIAGATGLAINAGHSLTGYHVVNSNQVTLQVWDAATGTTDLLIAEWSANGSIMFSSQFIATA